MPLLPPFSRPQRDSGSEGDPTDATPQVSFVVPLFNCLALTQAMVASLHATLPRSLEYELILIDDGSTDGTPAWLTSLTHPTTRVVTNEENLGFAASTNRGAAIARGRILALLNNDLDLTQGWFEPLLSVYRRLGDHAGAVGNIQRTTSNGSIDHTGIIINLKAKPEHQRALSTITLWSWIRGYRTAEAVTGACLLVGRDLWIKLGGFDERFVNGCEDVDFCFRAASHRKINAVAVRSVIRHHVSSSTGRKRRDEENTLRLVRTWRDTLVVLASRRWCWDYLSRSWTHPREPMDAWKAATAFFYGLHLWPTPPPFALEGMGEAVERELERWSGLGLATFS